MGNNPSTQQSPSAHIQQQPSRPPPSRRTSSNIVRGQRKRSLEFPEFQALTQANNPPPSSAIPIPMAAAVFQQPPSPPHSKAHYFPPSSAMIHPPPRQYPPVLDRHDPPQQHHHQQQPQQQPRQSAPAPARSSLKPAVVKEDALLVRSRLPLGLPVSSPQLGDAGADQPEGTQDATITWRGSAKEVYLTGISDSDRPYRVKMVHEPGSKSTFFTTLRLPPGNHPLRFIVDDQLRCTDTLPTATDTDGSLINYIEIPSPTHSPTRSRSSTNPSQATAATSITTNGWADGGAGSVIETQASGSNGRYYAEMEWVGEIPPRLFKLAAEEEAYLAARAAAAQPAVASSRHYPPLPPPPPVPYPPSLPRHLEKVILNNSSSARTANYTPAILASSSSARPRIIGTGTTGPLIPPSAPRKRAGTTGNVNPPMPVVAATSLPTASGILMHQTGVAVESLGDDNSVLPVPNHVVLNHLGTSAIKNGVLAVGTTTRYHRKYISTIYYKPI